MKKVYIHTNKRTQDYEIWLGLEQLLVASSHTYRDYQSEIFKELCYRNYLPVELFGGSPDEFGTSALVAFDLL